jgi:2-hydroxy-6-oxonona-2,4-dienedioate hydrolase
MKISFTSGCEERIAADGTKLRYYDVGNGDVTVVLLHGMFGSASNWLPIMQQLEFQYRFIALQLPIDADGMSGRPRFKSLSQLTQHVKCLFDELGLDSAVIGGNSLGGQIALDFCLEYPERTERLLLAGSAGLFERHLAGGQRPKLCRNFIREQANQIFHNTEVVCDELVDDIYAMLSDRGYRKLMLRIAKCTRDRYMLDDLTRVTVPTLIIWGQEDEITPPFVADQFHEHIRHSKQVMIDNCGHAPQLEQPAEFAAALEQFLAETDSSLKTATCKPR